jgi:phage/plasmid-like protein (TIGR03299 family)
MAHELDFSTGKAGVAYATGSAVPWHGLGQTVAPGASVEEWRKAGGLDWDAVRTEVIFNGLGDEYAFWPDKHVLYRSDTGRPLSVVSKDYQTVQPGQILGFFKDLADQGGFQIETVGSLKEGRRIWALARVGENAPVQDDQVAPYLMLATSFDGSMATTAAFTAVRIVCNNTLQRALTNSDGQHQVTIPHSAMFNPDSVRQELGIALTSWDGFMIKANKLADRKVTDEEMDAYLLDIIESPYGKTYTPEQVRNSKGYQRILGLFKGGQLGSGQDAINGTAWGLLQATTQFVDHEQGRLPDNRLDKAWFGVGAKFKEKAMKKVMELV